MASEPTLDLQRLAAPIGDDRPTGVYLKEADYPRLQAAKDLRSAAVAAERKQRELAMYTEDDLLEIPEADRQIEPPDWRAVRDACCEILSDHSKDLWVAAWLVEANTRLAGFAGLRDGFRLVRDLAESFWGDLYPPADEDEGYIDTVAQLTSLNGEDGPGTLIVPIQEIPLIPGHPEASFATYRQATGGGGQVAMTEAEFFAATRQVDPARLRDLEEDLVAAMEAFAGMNAALESRCGSQEGMPVAPPSSQIRSTLEEIRRTIGLLTRDVLSGGAAAGMAADGDAADGGTLGTAAAGDSAAPGGLTRAAVDPAQVQVNNREDAFRMLLKASEFFRKTEPHSPVSYMLQQAVRFGRMELPELLKELISDEDVLQRFAERTGIEVRTDDDDD